MKWDASSKHVLVLALAAFALGTTSAISGGEATGSDSSRAVTSGRVIVAILPFEDGTGDPDLAYRRYMEPGLLKRQLSHVKALRLRSEGAVKYGLRQIGLSPGDKIDPNHARAVGEHIEAQRVIWGRCRQEDGQQRLEAWVLNVATGQSAGPFPAAGTDEFDLRDALGEQILHALGIAPGAEERRKMAERWTTSAEALIWYGKGYMLQELGRPVAELEPCFRKALASDPNCAPALAGLAAALANQGQFGPAEDMARRALQVDANEASTHAMLTFILGSQQRFGEAGDTIREACRLDPDDADFLTLLARLYTLDGKWDEARAVLEAAVGIEPTNAEAHAALAEIYVATKNEPAALRELKEAAYFMPERMAALNVHLKLAETYERLGKTPEAVEHYTQVVNRATQLGVNPRTIRLMENRVRRLEDRLAPTFVEIAVPRRYSEQTLDALLSERLGEDERSLVGNPFRCTEAMRQWARELTRDATTDIEKARAIFDRMATRGGVSGQARSRTADDVFADWDNWETRLVCMDHAVLFVALARAVDVNAFFVQVTRDAEGAVVNHACAAVFDGRRALLADSSVRWFGAPHQEYAVLDDLQTAAFLCFYNEPRGDPLFMCRVGLKLWPDSVQGKLCLAGRLLQAYRPQEAEQVVAEVGAPAGEGIEASIYWMMQGLLARNRGDDERAEDDLRKAVKLCSTQATSLFWLGRVCLERGRLSEARVAFRECLRNNPDNAQAAFARQFIVRINEKIGFALSPDVVPAEPITP